jgi:hypothetical protein
MTNDNPSLAKDMFSGTGGGGGRRKLVIGITREILLYNSNELLEVEVEVDNVNRIQLTVDTRITKLPDKLVDLLVNKNDDGNTAMVEVAVEVIGENGDVQLTTWIFATTVTILIGFAFIENVKIDSGLELPVIY